MGRKMWESLFKLIFSKWLDYQTPKRKAAKQFMALYSLFNDCQEAYEEFLRVGTNDSYYLWQDSLRTLLKAHTPLGDFLEVLEPQVSELLVDYMDLECSLSSSHEVNRNTERGALRLQLATTVEKYNDEADPESIIADYTAAKQQLAQFIRKNFEFEDLFPV